MAIWEQPDILSGTPTTIAQPTVKPEVGICIIHTGTVTTNWAFRFRHLNIGYPYYFMYSANMPYDCSRELITREVLKQGVNWVVHIDSDIVPVDDNAIPMLIELAKVYDKPVITGLYYAKKREKIPFPCAWIQIGEDKEKNSIQYAPVDITQWIDKNALLAVHVCGAGFLVIKADIFKKLDESNPNLPYFQWGVNRKDPATGKPLLQLSEDFFFCWRCYNELKIQPHLSTLVKAHHICTAWRRASDGELEII